MTYIRLAKDKMQVMCSGITGYTRPQNDCSIIQSIYICSKYSLFLLPKNRLKSSCNYIIMLVHNITKERGGYEKSYTRHYI